MSATPNHLIERAAALLQGGASVPGSGPATDFTPDRPAAGPPERAALPGRLPSAPGGPNPVPPSPAPGSVAPLPSLPGGGQAAAAQGHATISIEMLEKAGMVMARSARSRISEEYRIVVGRVIRALRSETSSTSAQNALMVTSARPGEGKSFSALNLAGSIAQHGTDKVLLVDLDAKLRPLSSQLGTGDRLGFLDLVNNPSLRPEDLILQTALDNLLFLPVGSRIGGASDTNVMRPVPPTVMRLARRFPKHVIVLDAPPCLSTSDPHTVAPYVGQVVMVVEAERTQRSEVEAAIELVRVCPNITILLNKVRLTTSYTFGAYDYYGSYT